MKWLRFFLHKQMMLDYWPMEESTGSIENTDNQTNSLFRRKEMITTTSMLEDMGNVGYYN